MSDLIRVLRLLEYVGPREQVEETLKRSIKGTFRAGRIIIRSATLGDFPEVLEQAVREAVEGDL
jgi:hypothetical protein